ncbi:5909_t:CDS:2 [Cetraspora pellucida]|uniref:5909_t:CDS:1 n=1 Tax=Cetraspora pellucida TaxID=1433469 RepID=A0A9N9DN54_9GLOM|nr:5909_t:CDS:2 [Cetraspora pellucida]
MLIEPPISNTNDVTFKSNEDSTTVTQVDLTLTHTIDSNTNATLQQVDNSTQINDINVNDAKTDDTQTDDVRVGNIQSDTQFDTQIVTHDTQLNDTQADDSQADDNKINDTKVDNTKINDTQDDNTQVNDTQNDNTPVNDTQDDNIQVNDTQDDNTQVNDTQDDNTQHNDMSDDKTQLNDIQADTQDSNTQDTQDDTRLNAVIIVLVRNSELHQLRRTMRSFEDRWNKKFNYPYVFLNDQEFTDEFKTMTSALTNAKTSYGLIPQHMWGYPPWIDQQRAADTRRDMGFRHVLYEKYDYYWRLEPGVDFTCDINYDAFKFIKENNITYGFTIALLEVSETIPTLWKSVIDFFYKYPQFISDNNFASFITPDDMATYNGSEKYLKFFDFLDHAGGFYYER